MGRIGRRCSGWSRKCWRRHCSRERHDVDCRRACYNHHRLRCDYRVCVQHPKFTATMFISYSHPVCIDVSVRIGNTAQYRIAHCTKYSVKETNNEPLTRHTNQRQTPRTSTTSYNSRTQSDRILPRAEPRTMSALLAEHRSYRLQCIE